MSSIIAFLKSFNTLVSAVKALLEYYRDSKLRKVERQVAERNQAVSRINEKIKEEAAKEQPSDEAIKDLHRRLNNIVGKL